MKKDIIKIFTKFDSRGNLSILEGGKDIPFEIKRIFYIWNNYECHPRGGHAHKELQQAFIVLHGACHIHIDNGKKKKEHVLDDPSSCLIMPSGLWCDILNFSADCVLLVLCSDYYDETDYIRNYEEYLAYVQSH